MSRPAAERARAAVLPVLRSGGQLLVQRSLLLVALLALVFLLVSLLPGNAANATLGRAATEAEVVARAGALGLDRPLPERFLLWLGGLLSGDLGMSARGVPVADLIGDRMPATLLLGSTAIALTVVVSLPLGAWWAVRPHGRLARVLSPTTTAVVAIPEFVTASVLVVVFALWLDLLPAVSTEEPSGLVLPVVALVVPQVGWNTRVVRAALLDAAEAPHVEAAVLDGLPLGAVLRRHVLPQALPTIAASIATTVGIVLGGAIVVETMFNYPGVGSVLAGAVTDRDSPLLAGVVALTGGAILVMLLVADLIRHRFAGDRR